MEDERLNETIRQTLIASRQPPKPPLDEMWQQIERRAFGDARRPLMLHARQLHWRVPVLAAAAALAIGVGLGWYVAPRNVVTQIVASPTQSIARTSGTAATTTDHTSSTADTKHAANVQQLTSDRKSVV